MEIFISKRLASRNWCRINESIPIYFLLIGSQIGIFILYREVEAMLTFIANNLLIFSDTFIQFGFVLYYDRARYMLGQHQWRINEIAKKADKP